MPLTTAQQLIPVVATGATVAAGRAAADGLKITRELVSSPMDSDDSDDSDDEEAMLQPSDPRS